MGWISVKHKMPPLGDLVLVWNKDSLLGGCGAFIARLVFFTMNPVVLDHFRNGGTEFISDLYHWKTREKDFETLNFSDVTHWQPLPMQPIGRDE